MNDPERLYKLLPVVYRQRDSEQGYPLRALLRVIGEQVDVVEADIGRLYDNWFIETCEDWVVPYIGDLVGYRPVHEAGEPGDPRQPRARDLNKILVPRREVANTIRYRRRKGALALLELLANDVAGWPARAVEFYKLLCWTQHVNHLRLRRGKTVDLRLGDALERLDGPFDELAHTVDVRRINSHRTRGKYNIPSVGVFVCRLKAYSVTHAPAYRLEEIDRPCFSLNVLGHDTQLFTRPEPETEPTHIANELNLPVPIRRRAFEHRVAGSKGKPQSQASAAYYGLEKSVTIWAPDWPMKDAPQPVPAEHIIPADLSHWHYRPESGKVAVDPKLGRITFPVRQPPKGNVLVRYHYGFSADIGGGEYARTLSQPADHRLYLVGKENDKADCDTIGKALAKWTAYKQDLLGPVNGKQRALAAVIEIIDSRAYTEPLRLRLEKNESIQIRAANGTRPVLRLLDLEADRPDAFRISGDEGSRFTLDGLLVTGRGLQITGLESESEGEGTEAPGDLCDVTIRHCTLVPGWTLHCDCEPMRPTEPSLELINTRAHVKIEHSILGPVHVIADEVKTDPLCLDLSDSIWDATDKERCALSGPDGVIAHAAVTIARCTVLGSVLTHEIALAENCIFMGPIRVARRQHGCVRFCYVTHGSRTPRRYECQPDRVEQAVAEQVKKGELPESDKENVAERERLRVRPQFNSTRYGTPAYCQLADTCAGEIRRGADDESEMGAFHDLYQPQREANLRARLDEYTPAGFDAGIIHAS